MSGGDEGGRRIERGPETTDGRLAIGGRGDATVNGAETYWSVPDELWADDTFSVARGVDNRRRECIPVAVVSVSRSGPESVVALSTAAASLSSAAARGALRLVDGFRSSALDVPAPPPFIDERL